MPERCAPERRECTRFYTGLFESDIADCATSERPPDRRRCRRRQRRDYREDIGACRENFRDCRQCCRSGDSDVCAAAAAQACKSRCQRGYIASKPIASQLAGNARTVCAAIRDRGERKECREEVKRLKRMNKLALKTAREECTTCCELGGSDPCDFVVVLCGDGVVGPGEACDGQDDGACPGRCGLDCRCGSTVDRAFMTLAPAVL